MNVYLDFETYYSEKQNYSLKKVSMVEYIRDVRFYAFGAGISIDNGPVEWLKSKDLTECLDAIDWSLVTLIAHNIKFDGAILLWKYGYFPKQFVDTKGMSRAVLGKSINNHSLKMLAEYFGLESKGFLATDGKMVLTAEEEKALAEYCIHDVELCREIHLRLAKDFPENQYPIMDQTIRMFVDPKLKLNVPLLEKTAVDEAERRKNIFKEVGIDKSEFASNVKFPALLTKEGYDVPMKDSPRKLQEDGVTPVRIPALALGDPDFLEMLEEGNERLKTLCEARVAAKSTLLETRSTKLAKIGSTGLWPFDVEFSGADQTHRFSGGSGAGGNPQNFTRGSALREAVEAPEGYELVVGDFSNIELRLVAYLSKDPGLIGAIEQGKDIYCDFASAFYGRTITKADKDERHFGKCLAEGTLILCDSGWKKIETVTPEDKIWDGVEWVQHNGLINNGYKETIELNGLWLTPDHPILCGTQWKEAQLVAQDEKTHCLALAKGSEKLPSLDTLKGREAVLSLFYGGVIVKDQNGLSISQILKPVEHLDVTYVRKSPQELRGNYIGDMQTFWQTMNTVKGCLIGLVPPSHDAIIKNAANTVLTEGEAFLFSKNGGLIEVPSCDIYLPLKGGIIRLWKWIVSTIIKAMNQITSGLARVKKMSTIVAVSKTLKRNLQVYDLLSVGPRNRFTVLTKKGPLIVHNCAILGLGYGMGWKKFIRTVRTQTGDTIDEDTSRKAVDLYRTRYGQVPSLWQKLDAYIGKLCNPNGIYAEQGLPVTFAFQRLLLPSGLPVRFPNLRQELGDRGNMEWIYDVYRKGKLEKAKLYGGKLLENISQSLAGELCKEAMLELGNSVVGQVHDEIHVIVKKGFESSGKIWLRRVMTMPPKWMPNMLLDAEVHVGPNWGSCK